MLGGDLGGTSSRIVIAGPDGTVVGRGSAAGGNPTSHPTSAAANFGQALRQALTGLDPARVRGAVIGAAGGSALSIPEVRAAFEEVWTGAGLRCVPRYIGDLEVAFASGTPRPDGVVLIAGTGSAAGLVRDHRLVRTADGHGWLLGDDGSGFWLGREAVRGVLAALDREEPLGPLGQAVVHAILPNRETTPDHPGNTADAPGTANAAGAANAVDAAGAAGSECAVGPAGVSGSMAAVAGRTGYDRLRDDLIRTINARPPVLLAELARTVVAAHDLGDPAAVALVERAAELLSRTVGRFRTTPDQPEQPDQPDWSLRMDTADQVGWTDGVSRTGRPDEPDRSDELERSVGPVGSVHADGSGPFDSGPLVLAGSVAGEASPVGRLLRRRVREQFPGEVLTARDGVGGATWLALADLDPALATQDTHTRLVS